MRIITLLFLFAITFSFESQAQNNGYWQQEVYYNMDIQMDVKTNQFNGTQKLVYTNNSPDTLTKVFYHLFFNAFQPGSQMDVRSRTIEDPDGRIGNRIAKLKPTEIGFTKINSLSQNGKPLKFNVVETILEVELNEPILPGKKATFLMDFYSQVPLQIRRSGRDNKEDIRYSMTQWYPKLCEYDVEGWHANPYIGREFHGVFGTFEVNITIDSSYVVAATGVLQNKNEIGHGYQDPGKLKRPNTTELTWKFKAENVHDFAWAADPDYTHTIAKTSNGTEIHFFYQTDTCKENWEKLPEYAVQCFEIMNKTFGEYPFQQYSVIQGGDGGMEYPMATLIVGRISLRGLVSVTVHEAIHSWYQHILATNEAKYPWMDEGFTSYAQDYVLNILYGNKNPNPHAQAYRGYFNLVNSPKDEPLTVHSDHYQTNFAYGVNSYSKGQVFLHQLSYIIGVENLFKGMLVYYDQWKFKHPTPTDFKKIMEKVSGLELDWYFDYFIGTTNKIDYAIKYVEANKKSTKITLQNLGNFPMPIDVAVNLKNGEQIHYNIPLQIMRGQKLTDGDLTFTTLSDWPWVYPEYSFTIDVSFNEIDEVIIDPSQRLADVKKENNRFPNPKTIIYEN